MGRKVGHHLLSSGHFLNSLKMIASTCEAQICMSLHLNVCSAIIHHTESAQSESNSRNN